MEHRIQRRFSVPQVSRQRSPASYEQLPAQQYEMDEMP